MADLLGTLINFFFKNPAKWRVVDPGPPETTIEGQFQAEDYTEDVSTEWATLRIARRNEAHLQWSGGEGERASFTAMFRANTILDNISKQVGKLKALTRPDTNLGRPKTIRFVWGDIQFDCVVESVGGVKVGELWSDGRYKEVTFELALRRMPSPLALSPTDPSALPHLSRYRPVVSGQPYEALALVEYGNPLLGIYLRQDSTTAFPRAGKVVRLPAKGYYTGRRRVPIDYCLGNSDEAIAARRQVENARGGSAELPLVV